MARSPAISRRASCPAAHTCASGCAASRPEIYDRISGAAEGPRDPGRPIIEHYRRRDEIDVLLPVP
jgi:hypothetical protein